MMMRRHLSHSGLQSPGTGRSSVASTCDGYSQSKLRRQPHIDTEERDGPSRAPRLRSKRPSEHKKISRSKSLDPSMLPATPRTPKEAFRYVSSSRYNQDKHRHIQGADDAARSLTPQMHVPECPYEHQHLNNKYTRSKDLDPSVTIGTTMPLMNQRAGSQTSLSTASSAYEPFYYASHAQFARDKRRHVQMHGCVVRKPIKKVLERENPYVHQHLNNKYSRSKELDPTVSVPTARTQSDNGFSIDESHQESSQFGANMRRSRSVEAGPSPVFRFDPNSRHTRSSARSGSHGGCSVGSSLLGSPQSQEMKRLNSKPQLYTGWTSRRSSDGGSSSGKFSDPGFVLGAKFVENGNGTVSCANCGHLFS